MPHRPPFVPQLLVSVRSPDEATAAFAGGCDLLDVKEPSRGSLGMADWTVIAAVCERARSEERGTPRSSLLTPHSSSTPVSIALGELAEWPDDRPVPGLPEQVVYAKVGLNQCGRDRDWLRRWRGLRDRMNKRSGREVGWIAVLYADPSADGPEPDALIDLAATTGCRGVLIDTFRKDAGRLFDHVSSERLAGWCISAQNAGLLFAVAGSLREADLPGLAEIRPDIVAVRGAACGRGERIGDVSVDAVTAFRRSLDSVFG